MMIFWAPRRVLVLIQVGIKKQDCGPAVREFAPPCKASDTEATEQCFEPIG